MFSVRTCDYKCKDCDHTWRDAKQEGYEEMAYKLSGCPECGSKDCKWRHTPHEPMSEERLATIRKKMNRPGSFLGKPPKDFREGVLKRIKDHHETPLSRDTSSINLDW